MKFDVGLEVLAIVPPEPLIIDQSPVPITGALAASTAEVPQIVCVPPATEVVGGAEN